MNSSGPFSVLWQRKGLTFALLVLTLLGVGAVAYILPWTYKASITETLLDSKQSSEVLGGGNPYLSFNSPMVEMANLLTLELTNTANAAVLQKEGDTASFQAQVLSENPESEEPFIQIAISGKNEEAVSQTLQGVAASLNTLLTQNQSGVPTKSRLTLQTIAEVSVPVRSGSAKIKPAMAFLAVGLVLTFLIPQLIEGSAGRRRRRQTEVTAPVSDERSSRDFSRAAQPDLRRSRYSAEPGNGDFQHQWPDRKVEDDFMGKRVSPTRPGGSDKTRGEYGAPGLDSGRNSESERRWLSSSMGVQRECQ